MNNLINTLNTFKSSFFTLVSEFGPDYIGNFYISFNEIKSMSERQRITRELVQQYIDHIEFNGFTVKESPIGLELTTTARQIATNSNDTLKLAAAIETFRTRAALHGDYQNM